MTTQKETATTAADAQAPASILVWDAPVRVFHWLLVLSFAGAYLTAESERWRLIHVTLGYTMGGLLAFRVLWGLVGTRYARFTSFLPTPKAVMGYFRSLLAGKPEHHIGHNPAGSVAIVVMLLVGIAIVVTGWATYNDWGGEWLGSLHDGSANLMLLVVVVHVAGVIVASFLHRENLARAMVTGRKLGVLQAGIRYAWRPVAFIMVLAVVGFWYAQWRDAPRGEAAATGQQELKQATNAQHVDDHD